MSKHSSYQAKVADLHGHIDYSASEHRRWARLYGQQIGKVRDYAANEYLQGLDKLALPADRIPQCHEVSEALLPLTGWRVAPVPALIGFGRFFDMLARRVFPAASFIRSEADFRYVKEPDIFHEIFGHTPLLADPRFAAFSQAIGRIGQRARPEDYAWLARLYWFTIEFGLTGAGAHIKPLGAGLMSSPSELVYAATSDVPQRRPFDLMTVLRTPYRIDIHQPVYYVMEDLNELFALAHRDLLLPVRRAQALGLAAPLFPAIDDNAHQNPNQKEAINA